jgi:hypothetical protein
LSFLQVYPDLEILTYNRRIADNTQALRIV